MSTSATTNATYVAYSKLRAAVEEGLDDIVQRGDGSARVFQPLDPNKPVGSVAANMELVRACVAAWPRTGLPYEAASITPREFLPFAYAAERACRAAKRFRAAQIWSFIRRAPVDATRLAAGYPAPGGVSRILMSARQVDPSGKHPMRAHCTPEMLVFEKPSDTLAFARSELWPIDDAWKDGWAAIDKKVAVLRRLNCAWRGEAVDIEQVVYGLLGAGQNLSGDEQQRVESSNLEGIDLRGATITQMVLLDCRFKGSDFRSVSAEGAYIRKSYFYDARFGDADLGGSTIEHTSMLHADLRRAKIEEATLEIVDFSRANLEDAVLDNSRLACIFIDAKMAGVSMKNCAAEGANFQHADLRNAQCSKLNAGGAGFVGADLRGADFTKARLNGAKLTDARIEGADFTDAIRYEKDPRLPGWDTKKDAYIPNFVKLRKSL